MTIDPHYASRISEACDAVLSDPTEPERTVIPVAGMFWPKVAADMNAEFRRRGSNVRV
jgi:hypothetical protein